MWGLTADQLAWGGLVSLLVLITALVAIVMTYGGPPPPVA